MLGVGLQKFHMIKVMAVDLQKCYSEDDLPTAPWRFYSSFFPLPCSSLSLSTIVLNSRDRQGMYGMQHFRMPRNPPHNRL